MLGHSAKRRSRLGSHRSECCLLCHSAKRGSCLGSHRSKCGLLCRGSKGSCTASRRLSKSCPAPKCGRGGCTRTKGGSPTEGGRTAKGRRRPKGGCGSETTRRTHSWRGGSLGRPRTKAGGSHGAAACGTKSTTATARRGSWKEDRTSVRNLVPNNCNSITHSLFVTYTLTSRNVQQYLRIFHRWKMLGPLPPPENQTAILILCHQIEKHWKWWLQWMLLQTMKILLLLL